jgi:hypothetical protein
MTTMNGKVAESLYEYMKEDRKVGFEYDQKQCHISDLGRILA